MKITQKSIFIFILVFWAFILITFVGYKEFTLRTGRIILLNTEPIDPRDIFRGDYVTLRYPISSIELSSSFQDVNQKNIPIYVYLEKKDDNWDPVKVTTTYPLDDKQTLFLKGKIKSLQRNMAQVEYGIESFFVPEKKGYYLEKYLGTDRLKVKIAIDKFGNAVIKELLLDGNPINFQKLE